MNLDNFLDDKEVTDTIKAIEVGYEDKWQWYSCEIGHNTIVVPDQVFPHTDRKDGGFAYGYSVAEIEKLGKAKCRLLKPNDKVVAYPAEFFQDITAMSKFKLTMTYEQFLKHKGSKLLLMPSVIF